jgi:AcrR family transcriptional regulator
VVNARRKAPERRARGDVATAILDATEALLISEGHLALTTRRVAEEAGVNHGLIHYYFGSMEEVMLQTLERFTAQLTERQRAMYAADVPFIEKWRTAMHYLVTEDFEAGYEKIFLELQAIGWNAPEVRQRVARVFTEWYEILMPAFDAGLDELGVDKTVFPTAAVVSLVMTFNIGIEVERLSGFDSGHAALLRMIDAAIESAHDQQQEEAAR